MWLNGLGAVVDSRQSVMFCGMTSKHGAACWLGSAPFLVFPFYRYPYEYYEKVSLVHFLMMGHAYYETTSELVSSSFYLVLST